MAKVFKMIEIFNETKGKLIFQNYDTLFEHIKKIEEQKILEEERPELYDKPWDFIIHPNQRLSPLYWRAIKALSILLTNEEQGAYEQGYDLLEIYKGDVKSMEQIVLTPEINIEEMKEIWCQDYCLSNGYEIINQLH